MGADRSDRADQPNAADKTERAEVEAVLARRTGSDTRPTHDDLVLPYHFLSKTFVSTRNEGSSSAACNAPHWYCAKQDDLLVRDVATFLIYLFAFKKSEDAQTWLEELRGVLGCERCARGFGGARRRFEKRFLSAFPSGVIANFLAAVDKWFVGIIEAADAASLTALPASTLQMILSQPSLLEASPVADLLDASTSAGHRIPSPELSPVLVRLIAHGNSWATRQLSACADRPLDMQGWQDGVNSEVQELYTRPAVMATLLRSGAFADEAVEQGILGEKSLMAVLVPLLSGSEDYRSIFDCFAALLDLRPVGLWSFDPSPDLPHTLFASIKNNPAYHELLGQTPSAYKWITPYVLSLCDSDARAFGETLAKAAGFVFAEMQHTRIEHNVRAGLAEAGFEMLSAILRTVDRDNRSFSQFSGTLDVHAGFLASIAFRPNDFPKEWNDAREAALDFFSSILRADGKDLLESVCGLGSILTHERTRLKKKDGEPIRVTKLHIPSIRATLWDAAYNSVSPTDHRGAALLMRAIASYSSLEQLDRHNSWAFAHDQPGLTYTLNAVIDQTTWISAIRAINAGLGLSRKHFDNALENFAVQPHAREHFGDMAHSAMLLLLSPVDAINEAGLALVQAAFGVDDRSDSFRALLREHPFEAMDAMTAFLQDFIAIATKTPESCSLAKRLVRCFADIIDALCSPSGSEGPLLSSESFTSAHREKGNMRRCISTLWHRMTNALAVILKRTQAWAPLFENEKMVDWMRDALIFGSHLCDKVRLFEAAVLGANVQDKLSSQGRTLFTQLHVVLRDLVTWLRLTDVETLYQAFELVKIIIQRTTASGFDVTQSELLQITVGELEKYCRPNPPKSYTSKLTEDRISELSELLAPFGIADVDDFEIIEPAKATPPSTLSSAGPSSSRSEARAEKPKDAFAEMMSKAKARGAPTPDRKDAYALMMGKAYKPVVKTEKPERERPAKSKPQKSDDDFDDGFLSNLSDRDFAVIEQRAQTAVKTGKTMAGPTPSASKSHALVGKARAAVAAPKINVNVVPRPAPRPSATSGLLGQLRRDHRDEMRSRPQPIGGLVRSVPAASSVGTGLGAYQPVKPKPKPAQEDSSDSGSESDDGGGLSQLIKRTRTPLAPSRLVVPQRRIQMMSGYDDAMRKREAEKQERMRMKNRLHPDLGPLFEHVLKWEPEGTPEFAPSKPIPPTFSTSAAYEVVMEPLFLRELWAQSRQNDSSFPPFAVKITSRTYESQWIDIQVAVTDRWPDRMFLNDSDVVVLSQASAPKKIYARVQQVKKTHKDPAIKIRILAQMDQPLLSGQSTWMMQKHLSLSTALREYGALRSLPYYEPALLRDILEGRSAHLPMMSVSNVEDTMKTYEVNEPQAKAIIGSTQISGFALIQGPPGTGKTKTISGLVGKWLSDRKVPMDGKGKPKLLVCAPSNAAIDEVCKRLQDGVPVEGGRRVPMIVRIGIDSSVNDAVKDRSLDNLVEARVSSASGRANETEYGRLQAELAEVKAASEAKAAEMQGCTNDDKRRMLESEQQGLNVRRRQIVKASDKAKDAMRDSNRHLDGQRRAAKEAILNEADIVCATLSGSGQDILAAHAFDTVIIDEAAQAIELACLIPLRYGCKRCIMVGDPNQLPPTTFSVDAEKMRYNESLFVRMANRHPENMHLLSIQYRMHPDISELPSKVFYNSRLMDGPDMDRKTLAPWHTRHIFGPYRFFNVDGHEQRAGTSTKNPREAAVAVELYRRLEGDFGSKINLAMRIGVIAMYREQVYEMRRQFSQAYGMDILTNIEFNTVDGFQGQEKDIIIMSTVRSGPGLTSIGFLRDARRMNVALTRAKSSLFVIGNAATLERCDERWKTIVGDARTRGFIVDYKPDTFAESAPEPPRPPPAKKVKKEKKDALPGNLVPLKRKSEVSTSGTDGSVVVVANGHGGDRSRVSSPATDAGPAAKRVEGSKIKKEPKRQRERSESRSEYSRPTSVKSRPPSPGTAPPKMPPPPSRPPPPTSRPPPLPPTPASTSASVSAAAPARGPAGVPSSERPPPVRAAQPVARPPAPAVRAEDVAFRKKKRKPNPSLNHNQHAPSGTMSSRPLPHTTSSSSTSSHFPTYRRP